MLSITMFKSCKTNILLIKKGDFKYIGQKLYRHCITSTRLFLLAIHLYLLQDVTEHGGLHSCGGYIDSRKASLERVGLMVWYMFLS